MTGNNDVGKRPDICMENVWFYAHEISKHRLRANFSDDLISVIWVVLNKN